MNKNEKLMKASSLGRLDEVQHLVRKDRINVNSVKADFGWTPLMKAVKYGHLDIVRFLVEEAKADVNAKNNIGVNSLMIAARHGQIDTCKYLARLRDNVDLVSNDGRTALMCAAEEGHFEVVKFLTQSAHASVDMQDQNGYTALMYAAWNDHHSVVKYLVAKCHADVNIKNQLNKKALDLAKDQSMKSLLSEVSQHPLEILPHNSNPEPEPEPEIMQKLYSKRKHVINSSEHPTSDVSSAISSPVTTISDSSNAAASLAAQLKEVEVTLAKEKKNNELLSKELYEIKEDWKLAVDRCELIERELATAKRSCESMSQQVAISSNQKMEMMEKLRSAQENARQAIRQIEETNRQLHQMRQDVRMFQQLQEEAQVRAESLQEEINRLQYSQQLLSTNYKPNVELFVTKEICDQALISLQHGKEMIEAHRDATFPSAESEKRKKRKHIAEKESKKDKTKETLLNTTSCEGCLQKQSVMCAVPCAHMVFCEACYASGKYKTKNRNICPVCEYEYNHLVRIYFDFP